MICRLCLININVENKVSLFNEIENDGESQMLKLIAKYFFLEITQHDVLSTTICQECYNHLDEFHTFCVYVEKQQSTLRNEFLEVKCDAQLGGNNAETIAENDNDESLLDIKDVLLDNISPLQEPIDVQLKSEPDETTCIDDSSVNEGFSFYNENGIDSEDEDIPLNDLKEKVTKANSTTYKTTQRKRLTKSTKKTKASKDLQKKTSSPLTSSPLKIECDSETDHQSDSAKSKLSEKKISKTKSDKTATATNSHESEERDSFIAKHIQLKCDICDQACEKFSDVRVHFKEKHNCRPYVMCCSARLITRKDLFDHIHWHLNPAHFQCSICGKLFKKKPSLSAHLASKHYKTEDLIYNCSICEKSFARKCWLTQHMMYHQAEKSFTCEYCKKSFINKQRLEKHIRSMHDNIFPHICDVCGKKFKFKPSFDTHVLEHQGIIQPKQQCHLCGAWLNNKNRLRLHMATHNQIDVKCKYCGRECPTQTALRGHIQYMHRRPPSRKCKYCEKLFKTNSALEEHMATHTGVNLYNCPHCVKECRSRANMYVHIKRQHPQEWLAAQLARPSKAPQNVETIETNS